MSLAPSRLADFPNAVPDSAGIPGSVRDEMLIAPFNDIAAVNQLLDQHGADIAAVIVEPLQRVIEPAEGFLAALRETCSQHNVLLYIRAS